MEKTLYNIDTFLEIPVPWRSRKEAFDINFFSIWNVIEKFYGRKVRS